MKFTVEQTARGLATTFARGEYSLTVQRLRASDKPEAVTVALLKLLTEEEQAVLRRYLNK